MSQDLIFFPPPKTIEIRAKRRAVKTHRETERGNEYAFGDTELSVRESRAGSSQWKTHGFKMISIDFLRVLKEKLKKKKKRKVFWLQDKYGNGFLHCQGAFEEHVQSLFSQPVSMRYEPPALPARRSQTRP